MFASLRINLSMNSHSHYQRFNFKRFVHLPQVSFETPNISATLQSPLPWRLESIVQVSERTIHAGNCLSKCFKLCFCVDVVVPQIPYHIQLNPYKSSVKVVLICLSV